MTPQETLNKAADLLESSETAWTQGENARGASGDAVGIHEPEACSWCTIGALCKVEPNETYALKAVDKLRSLLDSPVHTWNDDPTTTKADVIAMMRKAAL